MLYQTNQGTDAHIRTGVVADVRDSESYRLHGLVAEPAQAIVGGHLFFPLQKGASRINCAAFEPTKNFRAIVKQLALGDELEVYGSVREGTLNLEKINILHLADKVETSAPICPQCQREAEPAEAIVGGHLFFPLQKGDARQNCAAFEPTKNFRAIVKQLILGDELEVYGSVREGTLNLEKLNIIHLAEKEEMVVPLCPECHKSMESAGKGQGYRCRRCKTHAEGRVRQLLPRDLETGYYEVPPCARRHLSKPLVRMNDDKVHPAR